MKKRKKKPGLKPEDGRLTPRMEQFWRRVEDPDYYDRTRSPQQHSTLMLEARICSGQRRNREIGD